MNAIEPHDSAGTIESLIHTLESLQDGERAEIMLIAIGRTAVPYLSQFLLHSPPRTIAEPRLRAVRALGALGACSNLVAYFQEGELASDAQVLFAEDAVRSAVANELLQWRTDETYEVLLHAAERRATEGLLLALGEFRRPESVALLFHSLEDDLCRDEAMAALRKVPEQAREYAIQSLKDLTNVQLRGGNAQWRCRATMKLLREFGVLLHDWRRIHAFLFEEDAEIVLNAAQIGLSVAPGSEHQAIVQALLRVADRFNCVQEADATDLLWANGPIARRIVSSIRQDRLNHGEEPRWSHPSWRVLQHVLDGDNKGNHYGAT
jgi:hypothetical protein